MSADRAIAAPATAESQWQAFLAQWSPPRVELDDLLPRHARLVIVAPHPDDEVLACGGLARLHARRGGAVRVIAVTDGEASHVGSPEHDSAWLASQRRAERLRGLAALGVAADQVVRLGLADGRVAREQSALEGRLTSLLGADDVVVSTWRFDGHPDHEATGAAVARACAQVECRFIEAPVWMWHWAAPGDTRVEWRRLRALPLDPGTRRSKQTALRAHASQLEARGPSLGPVLDAAIVARSQREFEYFLEAGPP